VFREKVIAIFRQQVARSGTAGARALFAARAARFDPPFALQLQQLLADGLAGEGQFVGELGDRAWTLALERDEDGAAAFGELFDGQNGGTPGDTGFRITIPTL
jgi:hypothetical protein